MGPINIENITGPVDLHILLYLCQIEIYFDSFELIIVVNIWNFGLVKVFLYCGPILGQLGIEEVRSRLHFKFWNVNCFGETDQPQEQQWRIFTQHADFYYEENFNFAQRKNASLPKNISCE